MYQGNLNTGEGVGAILLVQLSIIFKLSGWNRRKYKLCFPKPLILKLVDNCKSSSAPSPCIEISLDVH